MHLAGPGRHEGTNLIFLEQTNTDIMLNIQFFSSLCCRCCSIGRLLLTCVSHPGFDPYCHMNQEWWCMLVIWALEDGEGRKSECHSWLGFEFEASIIYVRLFNFLTLSATSSSWIYPISSLNINFSHYVAHISLKLMMYARLYLNSQCSSPSLPCMDQVYTSMSRM